MSDYPINYKQYLESSSNDIKNTILPINRTTMLNPEIKNLNLKAVEKIVLQKLLETKSIRSDSHFMKHRNAKHRSRLKTAG